MELQAYKMLQEIYALVTNDRKVLTTNEINYISGVLKTLLTLYSDEQTITPTVNPVDSIGEARRPVRIPKREWWRIFG